MREFFDDFRQGATVAVSKYIFDINKVFTQNLHSLDSGDLLALWFSIHNLGGPKYKLSFLFFFFFFNFRSSDHSERLAELQATVDEQKEEIDGYKKRLHKMVCTYPIYCVCIRIFRDNLKQKLNNYSYSS